jgi:HEAT repeat protein
MPTPLLFLVGLGLLVSQQSSLLPCEPDLAQLQEVLQDRQDPRGQSQSALLLVQSNDPAAEKIVREALKQTENEETFIALAAAVRLRADERFIKELLGALATPKARVRQSAAETLAGLPTPDLVAQLEKLARDPLAEVRTRQTSLWTLGRCGRKDAAGVLVEMVASDNDDLRRVAANALHDLTGQTYGLETARWQAWWAKHKSLTNEQWLQLRLTFQTTRAHRLEGELLRTRAQVLRLHQQVYTRLPLADRFVYVQGLVEQDDPGVRQLAIVWSLELLPTADAEKHATLATLLLRLTRDNDSEVQRAAVLALGRFPDASAYGRLEQLLHSTQAHVRAAAIQAISLQARGTSPEAKARIKKVVPLLQKGLEDKALEVVVEAAEALGMLGAPEAGPVLIGLLRHPAEHVRQTAAQALERTADAGLIDSLLRGLNDSAVMVRFSLVGALSKAVAAGGPNVTTDVKQRVLDRLEVILKRDADAGVRSRAATALGECGGAEVLPTLWHHVQIGADARVQQKAWDAMVEIVLRSGSLTLLETWDKKLTEEKQGNRRVQLWARAYTSWEQTASRREQATRALEGLAMAQIDQGKWLAAAPLLQTLLSRAEEANEALRMRCLQTLAQIAEQMMKEGNRNEARRILEESRGYLGKNEKLIETYERLQKLLEKE